LAPCGLVITIICDLEKRRIIDILSDREAATVTTWLAEHPTIARDRGAGYIQAATEGRPEAIQVGGPMAPDGERQCRVPHRRAAVDASDPYSRGCRCR
jgi:hypothetical protein